MRIQAGHGIASGNKRTRTSCCRLYEHLCAEKRDRALAGSQCRETTFVTRSAARKVFIKLNGVGHRPVWPCPTLSNPAQPCSTLSNQCTPLDILLFFTRDSSAGKFAVFERARSSKRTAKDKDTLDRMAGRERRCASHVWPALICSNRVQVFF